MADETIALKEDYGRSGIEEIAMQVASVIDTPQKAQKAVNIQQEQKAGETIGKIEDKKDFKKGTIKTGSSRKEEKENIKEILSKSEISLILDHYDDIFSDFDPRPYEERALSVDFLSEAKRASYEKKQGTIELRFLMPKALREPDKEAVIKRRLRDHFKRHHLILDKEVMKIKGKGAMLAALGFTMQITASYISPSGENDFFYKLAFVILEPGGWFFMWLGFEQMFSFLRGKNSEHEFYTKMAKAEIIFGEY